jgi:1,4-dihydroxy-6-naphthoate synthase
MTKTITISHSPDADDAFMFYGFEKGAVAAPGYQFLHDLCDIETLNHRALRGEPEVTAISVHTYPRVAKQYAIMRCGASMGGKDYGPKVVHRGAPLTSAEALRSWAPKTIAIPGELTSAALALQMYLREQEKEAELVVVPFDQVEDAVLDGSVDAGVIIHEGQLTHEHHGLGLVVDLGQWWFAATDLPLPLGINIVRRDLGPETMKVVSRALKESIEYALNNRQQALEYAIPFGRGITHEQADEFVGMYVNEYTRDIGVDGIRSIQLFLSRGAELGIVPPVDELLFV